jgi:hypothetical protein
MLPNLVVHVCLLAVTFVMADKNCKNFEGCLEGYIALHPQLTQRGALDPILVSCRKIRELVILSASSNFRVLCNMLKFLTATRMIKN